jgi:lipopolysaccharide/colanic/teichoic acid biosynthesis glycosyltransferase
MPRFLDSIIAAIGLILVSPFILVFAALIFLQDFHSPLYMAPRVGRNGVIFRMIKLRSMRVDADKSGVSSTANDDQRITRIGVLVRRLKLDELMQLINVIKGDMSLVGPRPNIKQEVDLYTIEEKQLITVRPGITDLASIVFSDEGDILLGSKDPDLAYNQLIRPGKGYLGLFYISNKCVVLDLYIILLTVVAVFNRRRALKGVARILLSRLAPASLIRIATRDAPLTPLPPPGATVIVTDRSTVPV